MTALAAIDRAFGVAYGLVGLLVGLTVGGFALSISVDLALRLFGWGNLSGLNEIIEYLLFAGVFLGAPWVLRQGSHVRVDLLVGSLPAPLARGLERLLDLVGCAVCLVLVHYGWVSLDSAWMFQSMQHKYFAMPEWVLLSVFVACFTLLAIEFLFRLLRGGAAPDAETDLAKGL